MISAMTSLPLPFGPNSLDDPMADQDQPTRLAKRAAASQGGLQRLLLVKKSSVSDFSSALDFPSSPTCIFQEFEVNFQQHEDEEELAAINIQKMIRGTLARWNVKVLRLLCKLDHIQALKGKQIKKIEQRKVQTMRNQKNEHEYREEHRIVRRRLRRAKCVRNQFAKRKAAEYEEHQRLKAACNHMAIQNGQCAGILQGYIQSMEMAQMNLKLLKETQQRLQETCQTYQTLVEVFQEVVSDEL